MSNMVPVTIDGRRIEVPYDTILLDAAKKLGISIPTMCHNENVKAYGVCRICLVEMRQGKRKKLVPACIFPLRQETEILTDSEWVRKTRAWIINLMLARSPKEGAVIDLARRFGIAEPNERFAGFAKKDTGDRYVDESACILCGLCVRTCEEVVGACAIAFENRGPKRRVTSPFSEQNEACIACGACEFVCPTKCIGFLDHGGERELVRWKKKTRMIACEKCGDYFMPESLAKVYKEKMNIPEDVYKLCTDCRASVFA